MSNKGGDDLSHIKKPSKSQLAGFFSKQDGRFVVRTTSPSSRHEQIGFVIDCLLLPFVSHSEKLSLSTHLTFLIGLVDYRAPGPDAVSKQ